MCGSRCQAEGRTEGMDRRTGQEAQNLRTSRAPPAGRGSQWGKGPGSRQPILAAAPRAVPASQCPTADPSLGGQVSSRPGARQFQGPQRNR